MGGRHQKQNLFIPAKERRSGVRYISTEYDRSSSIRPPLERWFPMNEATLRYVQICANENEHASVQKLSCADVRQLLRERKELLLSLKELLRFSEIYLNGVDNVTQGAIERAQHAIYKSQEDEVRS